MSEQEMIMEMAKALYESEYDAEDYPWSDASFQEKQAYLRLAEAAVKKLDLMKVKN